LDFTMKFFEFRIVKWHRTVGIDKDTFDSLVLQFQNNYFETTLDGKIRTNAIRTKDCLSPRSALLITLYFLRQYPTGLSLHLTFGTHERTLIRHITRTMSALKKTLQQTLHWPNASEVENLPEIRSELEELDGHLLIVDGTVIKTHREMIKFKSKHYDPYWSGHKKTHGFNVLAFVDYHGKIYVDDNFKTLI